MAVSSANLGKELVIADNEQRHPDFSAPPTSSVLAPSRHLVPATVSSPVSVPKATQSKLSKSKLSKSFVSSDRTSVLEHTFPSLGTQFQQFQAESSNAAARYVPPTPITQPPPSLRVSSPTPPASAVEPRRSSRVFEQTTAPRRPPTPIVIPVTKNQQQQQQQQQQEQRQIAEPEPVPTPVQPQQPVELSHPAPPSPALVSPPSPVPAKLEPELEVRSVVAPPVESVIEASNEVESAVIFAAKPAAETLTEPEASVAPEKPAEETPHVADAAPESPLKSKTEEEPLVVTESPVDITANALVDVSANGDASAQVPSAVVADEAKVEEPATGASTEVPKIGEESAAPEGQTETLVDAPDASADAPAAQAAPASDTTQEPAPEASVAVVEEPAQVPTETAPAPADDAKDTANDTSKDTSKDTTDVTPDAPAQAAADLFVNGSAQSPADADGWPDIDGEPTPEASIDADEKVSTENTAQDPVADVNADAPAEAAPESSAGTAPAGSAEDATAHTKTQDAGESTTEAKPEDAKQSEESAEAEVSAGVAANEAKGEAVEKTLTEAPAQALADAESEVKAEPVADVAPEPEVKATEEKEKTENGEMIKGDEKTEDVDAAAQDAELKIVEAEDDKKADGGDADKPKADDVAATTEAEKNDEAAEPEPGVETTVEQTQNETKNDDEPLDANDAATQEPETPVDGGEKKKKKKKKNAAEKPLELKDPVLDAIKQEAADSSAPASPTQSEGGESALTGEAKSKKKKSAKNKKKKNTEGGDGECADW